MNGVDGDDSPILAIYDNLDISHDKPLEINVPIPNLVILRDSYGPEVGYVKSVELPFSPPLRGIPTLWLMWKRLLA